MYPRYLLENFTDALSDTPVVLLNGARQTGKSTLVRSLIDGGRAARYLTFDDAAVLALAAGNPEGFLVGLERPVILDEVQRVPELFLALKAVVDRDRTPGQFILTGSVDVLSLPRIAESLAGRMEILTLRPLSQGEIGGVRERFIDAVFAEALPSVRIVGEGGKRELLEAVLRGGYPEVLLREREERRRAWFSAYITTILQRDVREQSNIEGLTEMPRLLALLATRCAMLLNFSELSRGLGIPQTTLKRYMALLETTFLVEMLPAWSGNMGKRLVKSSKILLVDTGLCAYLQGGDLDRLEAMPHVAGQLVENFVAGELAKQSAWSLRDVRLYHFRTQSGQEVDLVLEDRAGNVVGIEVKSAESVTPDSFKGLRLLADELGDKFRRGVVLYGGRETIPFDARLHAMPIRALWGEWALDAS